MTEIQAVVDSMGSIGENDTKGRDGRQSGGNVTQDGGTGRALIHLGLLSPFDGNVENGVRDTHRGFCNKSQGRGCDRG